MGRILTIFEKEDSNAKGKMADIVLVNLAFEDCNMIGLLVMQGSMPQRNCSDDDNLQLYSTTWDHAFTGFGKETLALRGVLAVAPTLLNGPPLHLYLEETEIFDKCGTSFIRAQAPKRTLPF